MDDVALANYIAGISFAPVEAGRLHKRPAGWIGVPAGSIIWFSDYTLNKLFHKHGEINFQHYRNMPNILINGIVLRGRTHKLLNVLWINFATNSQPIAYFVVMKATIKREVFIETFHRVHLKEARRIYRKAKKEGRILIDRPLLATRLNQ